MIKILCCECGGEYSQEDYIVDGYSSITECPYCRTKNLNRNNIKYQSE